MANQWYYKNDEQQQGPVNDSQLRNLAKSGQLTRETLIWKEGMKEWKRASQLKGLFPQIATAAPPPIPKAEEASPESNNSMAKSARQAGSSFAKSAKLAGQLAAIQAKKAKLTTIDLPAAFYELGKQVLEAGGYKQQFPDEYSQIDKCDQQIAIYSETTLTQDSSLKQKLWAGTDNIKKTGLLKAAQIKRDSSLRSLGKVVFSSNVKDVAFGDAISKIKDIQKSIDETNAEIQRLSTLSKGRLLTPKRLIVGSITIAAALTLILFLPKQKTNVGLDTEENPVSITNSKSDGSDGPAKTDFDSSASSESHDSGEQPNDADGDGDPYVKMDSLNTPLSYTHSTVKIEAYGRLAEQRIRYTHVDFSPDETTLLAGGEIRQGFLGWEGVVLVANARSGRTKVAMQQLTKRAFEFLAVSPDNKSFATLSGDKKVSVWNYRNPEQNAVFDLPYDGEIWTDAGGTFFFSPDGLKLFFGGEAQGSSDFRGLISAWDLAKKREIFSVTEDLFENRLDIKGTAFLSEVGEGNLLATHANGSVSTWTITGEKKELKGIQKTGTEGTEKSLIAQYGNSIAWLHTQKDAASLNLIGAGGNIRKLKIDIKDVPKTCTGVKISSDGRLFSAFGDGAAIWDCESGLLLLKTMDNKALQPANRFFVADIALPSKGNLLAIAEFSKTDNAGTVWVWQFDR